MTKRLIAACSVAAWLSVVHVAECAAEKAGTFGDDIAYLQGHTKVVLLSDKAGQAQVAILPAMQGRVMTSTAGANGTSYGWINRELITSGKVAEHINVFGGENRFWIGPEGGQFSVFFTNGVPFDLAHWHTPAAVDTEAFDLDLDTSSPTDAVLHKNLRLVNYSGTAFDIQVKRSISLLSPHTVTSLLGIQPAAAVKAVAYESDDSMMNAGKEPWKKETGLLSIWILGMFNPSPATTIVVPFKEGSAAELGPIVNDAYFGKVPTDRLVVGKGVLFFSADGCYRSKIGLSPKRALPVLGSYDADSGTLTIVQFNKPADVTDYVNSMWEMQKSPFGGDAVNSYNDGPPSPGAKPLGPFYELETSSPAAALAPGKSIRHVHRTFHLQGAEADLNPVAKKVLGVTIADIKSALKAKS